MSWNANLPADTSKIRLSAAMIRNNQAAVQNVLTLANLSGNLPYIPTAFPMWFYTDVAPPGWTIFATQPVDSLLAIKNPAATSVYNVPGGTQAGTWLGPPHTLTIAEIPSHTHPINAQITAPGGLSPGGGVGVGAVFNTGAIGGGGAHQHDWGTARPQAGVGILCTKNP